MDNKISVGALSGNLARATGKSKKLCEDFIREFFKLAAEGIEESTPLKIKGFGTFKVVEVDSRESVNINTGERHEIQAFKKVVFTPSKEMAEAINAPFREFESVEIDDEIPDEILLEAEMEDTPESNTEAIAISGSENEPEAGENIQDDEISDEDRVSNYRLEEGSAEEGEDDEITSEAYRNPESGKAKEDAIGEAKEGLQTPEVHEIPEAQQVEAPAKISAPVEVPEPAYPVYEEEYKQPVKSRFSIGFFTGALSMLCVCVVIFMLGCFFDWWPVNFGNPKNLVEQTQIGPVAEQTEGENPIEAETMEETPPVYDTVSTTRYLTTISREHYGDYNFWPYIYLENESILGHPDRITPGTKVVVPPLSKYGVDPSNPDDVKAAKRKGLEIYSKFK